jgi:hypothetical protein
LSLAPEYILEGKWTTMVDESTLNLKVILHGITQTRCIVVPKATCNAHNSQQRLLLCLPFIHDCLTSKLPLGKMGDQPSRDEAR